MPRFLLLRLEAPLLAFGGEVVDARGVLADFPGASLLTGLLANALGYRRGEAERLQALQDRLVFAARLDRAGARITDFQTVQLDKDDRGWTTRGRPEGRAGGAGSYAGPHLRRRDYDCDVSCAVALRLTPSEATPTLDDLVTALLQPERPLFLGRKPCLPSRPLLDERAERRIVDAESLLAALGLLPPAEDSDPTLRIMLPASEPAAPGDHVRPVTDARNWRSGVHGGHRLVRVRAIARAVPRPGAAA
ncbi:type I-E CRISPR-associated protein Cas5/CasD [Methylobacterium terricola]|uniref:Type I-E CRISPR-associated protein Cas5/CasD n=1 Tax=Methylobacterium terricola TaxID=2583531 RepID=A0A5C4LH72_9HYPH|nr:type I-E CRISPR-associated protein Cas5/CasD [Methylobacterium terricola]TNC12738.1 type I-E CRISPR-associated protein Cas5/CasD [Methylobacterium terricola]